MKHERKQNRSYDKILILLSKIIITPSMKSDEVGAEVLWTLPKLVIWGPVWGNLMTRPTSTLSEADKPFKVHVVKPVSL